jgi:hypothetical protein
MRRFLIPLLTLALMGCATIDIDCPDDGTTTTVAVGGNTVGLTLLTFGLAAAKGAGFAKQPAAGATTTASTSHVHYTYVPIFGNDGVSCAGHVAPAAAPTPTIIMQPNPPAQAYIVK